MEARSSTPATSVSSTSNNGSFAKCKFRFSGRTNKDVDIIDAVEIYKDCALVSDENALRGFSMLLTGPAATWWLGRMEKAVDTLRVAYEPSKPASQIYREIFAQEQDENTRIRKVLTYDELSQRARAVERSLFDDKTPIEKESVEYRVCAKKGNTDNTATASQEPLVVSKKLLKCLGYGASSVIRSRCPMCNAVKKTENKKLRREYNIEELKNKENKYEEEINNDIYQHGHTPRLENKWQRMKEVTTKANKEVISNKIRNSKVKDWFDEECRIHSGFLQQYGNTNSDQTRENKFHHNGYLYVFDKTSKSDVSVKFWRCKQIGRCNARLHTRDAKVIKQLNFHSHAASAVDVCVVTSVKCRAEATVKTSAQVVNECLDNLSQEGQAAVSSSSALRKTIRQERNQV
ncbi:hypothetical protein ILUMI_23034 [Ignelater luminosus]|uniref:FLYWCH-type domain-containing protein n=1 Tax=Ignelater luminosus TaxID=2038154 RepID=A0A8K0FX43_IGNLU|nr:hypothetical protein ILUMI_23034 [Ignelater luminosus]